jgi:glycosyltransferase involved in cell wall biosynthesis
MRQPAVWIAWERHRRSRELSSAFDAELIEVVSALGRPWKYPVLFWQTIACIALRRPAVVFAQCPSVLLGVIAALLRRLFGFTLVLDLHNECVEPCNYSSRAYVAAIKWMWRASDVCVVTNHALAEVIGTKARHVCILPDRIPDFDLPEAITPPATSPMTVVFICTFAPDEPYTEVIAAARLLPEVEVHVTGNPRGAALPNPLPANVRLRGYLPEREYEDLLRCATVIVDLTSLENCLVCGAYEAVALEKPLVTSDTAALKQHFRRGTVYTKHTPEGLAAAVDRAVRQRHELVVEMRQLRESLGKEWATAKSLLESTIVATTHP